MLKIIGTETAILQLDTWLGAAGSSGPLGVGGTTGLEIIEISRGCEAGISSSWGMVSTLSMVLPLPPVGATVGRVNNQAQHHSYIDLNHSGKRRTCFHQTVLSTGCLFPTQVVPLPSLVDFSVGALVQPLT